MVRQWGWTMNGRQWMHKTKPTDGDKCQTEWGCTSEQNGDEQWTQWWTKQWQMSNATKLSSDGTATKVEQNETVVERNSDKHPTKIKRTSNYNVERMSIVTLAGCQLHRPTSRHPTTWWLVIGAVLQHELCNNGECQLNEHHIAVMVDANVRTPHCSSRRCSSLCRVAKFYFIFLLHATPNPKGLQGKGLCVREREHVSARERKWERKKTSPRCVTPLILTLLVGRNVTAQAPSSSNNTGKKNLKNSKPKEICHFQHYATKRSFSRIKLQRKK
jgi:hypothetical protein